MSLCVPSSATQGTMKGITARQVCDTGTTLILNNTYHLSLRPGTEILDLVGGVPIESTCRGGPSAATNFAAFRFTYRLAPIPGLARQPSD